MYPKRTRYYASTRNGFKYVYVRDAQEGGALVAKFPSANASMAHQYVKHLNSLEE